MDAPEDSREGGFARMCFAAKGVVELLSYNEYYREALGGSARFVVQDQKLQVMQTSSEAWPFERSQVACSVVINPRVELHLYDCAGAGEDVGLELGAKAGRDVSDSRWNYDGEDIDG